jgi:hypothetical protein
LVAFGLLVLGPAGLGAADDSEGGGDLQPIAPVARFQIPNFRNFGMMNDLGCALSPDGKSVAVTTHGNFVMLYDLLKSKEQVQPRQIMVENHQFHNSPLAFTPDGKSLVAAGPQHGDPTFVFLDVKSGKEVRQIDNDQPIFGLALSGDGKRLAVATQQGLELWDADTGDEVRTFAGPVQRFGLRPLVLSSDGKMLATVSGPDTVEIWETASGRERQKLHVASDNVAANPRFNNAGPQVGALAFSADGRLLAAGCDQAVHVWDLMAGQELPPLVGNQGVVRALQFSPDGRQLIAFDNAGLRLAWSVSQVLKSARATPSRLSDGEFQALWEDLAEADAFGTYRAARHMSAEPERALTLLSKHMHPVPPGDPERIAKLVGELQNANSGVRRKALGELRKQGEAALGALTQTSGGPRHSQAAMFLANKLEAQCATPERARALKAVQILEQIGTPEARQLLEKLAGGAAGTRLTVAAKAALDRLPQAGAKTGTRPGGVETLWSDLASEDGVAAFGALRRLAAVPGEAVPLVRQQLKPVQLDAQRLDQLLADLDSNEFAVRQKATGELEQLGELAEPGLKRMLASQPPLETRKRIEQLLAKLAGKQAPSGGMLRTARAIELLERIHTAEACAVLQSLASGAAESQLTQEARASLERISKVGRMP